MMARLWIVLGAAAGLTGVAMAALTAHAMSDDAARQIAHSAVEMQMWHALALVGTGLWAPRGGRLCDIAGAAFVLGLLAFCGEVYSHAFNGFHIPHLAPTGGVLLMIGWAVLAVSAIRPSR